MSIALSRWPCRSFLNPSGRRLLILSLYGYQGLSPASA